MTLTPPLVMPTARCSPLGEKAQLRAMSPLAAICTMRSGCEGAGRTAPTTHTPHKDK